MIFHELQLLILEFVSYILVKNCRTCYIVFFHFIEPESIKVEKKKKKKKKKVSAAIVSIEEEINDTIDSATELEKVTDEQPSATPEVLSRNNSSLVDSAALVVKGAGHSRAFSYPGRSTSTRTEGGQTHEADMKFLDVTKATSVPDNLVESLKQENHTKEEQTKGKTFVESFKFKSDKSVPRNLLGSESQNMKVDFFVRSPKDEYDANNEDILHDGTANYPNVKKNMKDEGIPSSNGGLMSATLVALQCDERSKKLSERLNAALEETERGTSPSLHKCGNQIYQLEQKSNLDEIVCRNSSQVSPPLSDDKKQSELVNGDLQADESKLLNTMEGELLVGSPVADYTRELDSPVALVGNGGQLITIISDNGEDTEMVIQIPQQESGTSSQIDQINPVDSSKDDLSISR